MSSSTIKLIPYSAAMADDLTEMYLKAFASNPANYAMLGEMTPEKVELVKKHRKGGGDMAGESASKDHDYAIVDTSLPPTNPAVPDGAIIGRGTWKVEDGTVWRHPVEELFVPGCNEDAFRAFFGTIDDLRNKHIGGKKLWHLTFLFTDPKYRGRGGARYFVEWGTRQADEQGLECYMDGTEAGRPLYEKCGFEILERGELDLHPYGVDAIYPSYCMLRKSRKAEE